MLFEFSEIKCKKCQSALLDDISWIKGPTRYQCRKCKYKFTNKVSTIRFIICISLLGTILCLYSDRYNYVFLSNHILRDLIILFIFTYFKFIQSNINTIKYFLLWNKEYHTKKYHYKHHKMKTKTFLFLSFITFTPYFFLDYINTHYDLLEKRIVCSRFYATEQTRGKGGVGYKGIFKIDGKEDLIRISKSSYDAINRGENIRVQFTFRDGFLGYQWLKNYRIINQNK